MIEQGSSLLPIHPFEVAQFHLSLIDPKSEPLPAVRDDLSNCASPAIVASDTDVDHLQRRMSTSTASVPDTESSIASRPDKTPSQSSSPQPPTAAISSEQPQSWNFAASGQHADDKSASDPTLDTSKVQLPSIFTTFQDPFRSEIRRASLPSLSGDSSTHTRYRPSPYPLPSARRSHIPINQSNLGSYHFPSSLDTQDAAGDKSSGRPRLDTHLTPAYGDTSPYPHTSLSSSTASSSHIPPSTFGSPLTPDLRPVSYIEGDSWSNSPPGIARPSSTPGQPPMSGPIKYDDTMRHSSFNGQPQMYPNTDRLAGQQDRRVYPTSSAPKSEEWSFANHQDFVLPQSNPYNTTSTSLPNTQQPPTTGTATPVQPPSSSPTRSPQQPPAPSTLVDRPTRKRGKLPKETTDYLKAWLHRHSDHPYPSEEEKKQLCHATGLSMSQVSNWMINARRRILAPAHKAAQAPTTSAPYPPQGRTVPPSSTLDPLSRRSSMPADSLHLYHPMSLQGIGSGVGGPSVSAPDYGASSRHLLGAMPGRTSHQYNGGSPGTLGGGLDFGTAGPRLGMGYAGGGGHSHHSGQGGGGGGHYIPSGVPMSAPSSLSPSNHPFGSHPLNGTGGSGNHHGSSLYSPSHSHAPPPLHHAAHASHHTAQHPPPIPPGYLQNASHASDSRLAPGDHTHGYYGET
ncbi:hypothetical protein PISMIDRAFT_675563 [Pisolithus microcarpus 441]|uniref:Homeobox domain-containing protein n=1 Tax=Pisolithus microcarpus 441 TaxID=765257 RepID=A0A0C9YNP8_9AGAM|nr:hypothetical protein PISMIDRAFT_675563 [Pisolithus microcarpus 441]